MSIRLTISNKPASVIKDAVAILGQWIDPTLLRLGGGTALAARWHHRTSTDLDFFSASEEADSLFYKRHPQMMADLVKLASDGRISSRGLRMTELTVVHFEIDDIPISCARTDVIHGDSLDEIEAKTGVVLSSNDDILTKKLRSRVASNHEVTVRDTYDFLVATKRDRSALKSAWFGLHEEMKINVIELFREMRNSTDPMQMASGPRGLVDSEYPELIHDLWGHALRLFASDLEYQPIDDVR